LVSKIEKISDISNKDAKKSLVAMDDCFCLLNLLNKLYKILRGLNLKRKSKSNKF